MIKNKYLPIFSILFLFVLSSCSKNIETLSVIRTPYLTAKINNESLAGSQFIFNGPTDEVAYLSDTAKTGKKVFRYNFQSNFKNAAGQALQLIITFDSSNKTDFRGNYTQSYTSSGGIFQVVLLKQTNENTFVKYELKNQTGDLFQINRLGDNERIFAGNFKFTLQNLKNTADIIILSEGKFEDIQY